MRVYVICPVRRISDNQRADVLAHVSMLEDKGHIVFVPFRDNVAETPENGLLVCRNNRAALEEAEAILVFWDPMSAGSIFDLGMAFALRKSIMLGWEIQRNGDESFENLLLALTVKGG